MNTEQGIPVWHCTECHAEWTDHIASKCYACGAEGEIIGHEKPWGFLDNPEIFDRIRK